MAILDPDFSNLLQFFTLPAEIIGISLAYIEFAYPRLARKANVGYQRVISQSQRRNIFRLSSFVDQWKNGILIERSREDERYGLVYSRISLGFGFVFISVFVAFIVYALSVEILAGDYSSTLFLFSWLAVALLFFSLPSIAARLVPARPLGGIGLILAGLGVFGECDQMAVFMFESSDPASPMLFLIMVTILLCIAGWTHHWVTRDNMSL